jgi:hypothetical protein
MRNIKNKIIDLRSIRDTQFQSFDHDHYNLGLYNGIELSFNYGRKRATVFSFTT